MSCTPIVLAIKLDPVSYIIPSHNMEMEVGELVADLRKMNLIQSNRNN